MGKSISVYVEQEVDVDISELIERMGESDFDLLYARAVEVDFKAGVKNQVSDPMYFIKAMLKTGVDLRKVKEELDKYFKKKEKSGKNNK